MSWKWQRRRRWRHCSNPAFFSTDVGTHRRKKNLPKFPRRHLIPLLLSSPCRASWSLAAMAAAVAGCYLKTASGDNRRLLQGDVGDRKWLCLPPSNIHPVVVWRMHKAALWPVACRKSQRISGLSSSGGGGCGREALMRRDVFGSQRRRQRVRKTKHSRKKLQPGN